MTVKQFNPKQTITLETSNKVIEEQAAELQQSQSAQIDSNRAAKVGLVSLG